MSAAKFLEEFMMLFISGKMRLLPLSLQYAVLLAAASCASVGEPPSVSGTAARRAEVRPGIEVLVAGDMAALRGLRVGLITNHTGKTRSGESSIDVLHNDARVRLVSLFAPEHGIRGAEEGGVRIEAGRDTKTGLPIHSLYGQTQKPTAEMLQDVDALVFDIQDIGARYYTYPWTMALAMQAAAEHRKRFVVLDRPNPIGGELVQGNINDTTSFVGLYPVPMRHGMTVGEIARFVNREFNINADLVVIPVAGLQRSMWFEQTGLPWTPPSPNMPSIESATHYPGLCIFEGTNISVGRGTPTAFQLLGAPWLNARELINRLNSYKFPGVRFDAVTFTAVKPGDNKYPDQVVTGVRFITTDRRTYDPTKVAVAALLEIRKLHPAEFRWGGSFPRLYGVRGARALIESGAGYDQLVAGWDAQVQAFRARRQPYLLY
jgi:uncharacterized protein YbbC (DUF1343 family)